MHLSICRLGRTAEPGDMCICRSGNLFAQKIKSLLMSRKKHLGNCRQARVDSTPFSEKKQTLLLQFFLHCLYCMLRFFCCGQRGTILQSCMNAADTPCCHWSGGFGLNWRVAFQKPGRGRAPGHPWASLFWWKPCQVVQSKLFLQMRTSPQIIRWIWSISKMKITDLTKK